MIRNIVFDVDGLVIHREEYFSQRFAREFNLDWQIDVMPFFTNEFRPCLVGKADLKDELKKYLPRWKWKGSADEFLTYWFEGECDVDQNVMQSVKSLRSRGIKCYMATNNEKYRTRHLLEVLGLQDQFDGAFASGLLGCMKPQHEFWSAVYDSLGKPAKAELLVWDDDEENVQSALDFGFEARLYVDFVGYAAEMSGHVFE